MQLVQNDYNVEIMPVAICLVMSRAHTISHLSSKILMLIKWSYMSPQSFRQLGLE